MHQWYTCFQKYLYVIFWKTLIFPLIHNVVYHLFSNWGATVITLSVIELYFVLLYLAIRHIVTAARNTKTDDAAIKLRVWKCGNWSIGDSGRMSAFRFTSPWDWRSASDPTISPRIPRVMDTTCFSWTSRFSILAWW